MNFKNYMTDYNPCQEMAQIQCEVNRIFEGVSLRGRTVFLSRPKSERIENLNVEVT